MDALTPPAAWKSPLNGFACIDGRESLVFGERPDGSIVHVSELTRGTKYTCICPGCQSPLVARLGDLKAHHFAHKGTGDGRPCKTGPETALHKFAKEILARELHLRLPPLKLSDGVETWTKFAGGDYPFDCAKLETTLGRIVPDVTVWKREHELIVEFVVTHECGPEKIEKIRELDIAAIEIYLSDLPPDITRESLEKAILEDADRKWLHNPRLRDGATELEARRRKREEAFARQVAALQDAYTAACGELTVIAPGSRSYMAAVADGLGAGIGLEVPGKGCFTVPTHDWQAEYLMMMVPRADRKTARLLPKEIVKDMRARGWVRREFNRVNNELVRAIQAERPDFTDPFHAVKAWLTALAQLDLVQKSPTDHRWSLTARANQSTHDAQHLRERPRLRAEEIREAVAAAIGNLPQEETDSFSFDLWFSRLLPGRGYSPAQAMHFADQQFASLRNEVTKLRTTIRVTPRPDFDLMGLPLQPELERRLDERRLEAERREIERQEHLARAAQNRTERVQQEAWQGLGADGDAWVLEANPALNGKCPSEVAHESDAGLGAALKVLRELVEHREAEERKADDAKKAIAKFRKAAMKIVPDKYLDLFMRSSHLALNRKSPEDYCVDEASAERCIELTLPGGKRRR